jgi:hypothetical protein
MSHPACTLRNVCRDEWTGRLGCGGGESTLALGLPPPAPNARLPCAPPTPSLAPSLSQTRGVLYLVARCVGQ